MAAVKKRSSALSVVVALVVTTATAVGIVKLVDSRFGSSTELDAATVAASRGRSGSGGERADGDGDGDGGRSNARALSGTTIVGGADGNAYTAYTVGAPASTVAPGADAAPGPAPAAPSAKAPGSVALPLTAAQAAALGSRPTAGGATTASPTTATTTKPTTAATSATTKATTATTKATTATTAAAATGGISSVEQQIVQMTNELRTNPNGPLARKGATPSCVKTDGAGKIEAVPALKVNTTVAIQLSRDWSKQMDAANAMSHRPSNDSLNFYKGIGLSVSTWGENVAWFSGYSDAQAAQVFFEGWRESDGHYCNMMNGSYTYFGVGVYKGASKTWATQNFYATR